MTSAEDLFFFAHTRDEGYELYHYSELEVSINIVEEASSNVYNASSSIAKDNKYHLWKTDGTSDSTIRLDFIP